MSGKLKRLLAILAALGITASGTIEFLGHVTAAFPQSHTLGSVCAAISTVLGLLVAYHPVSIKAPNQPQGLQQPDARTKQ